MKEQLMNYLVTNTGALTLQDVLLNFLMAAVFAAVIFLSYRVCHSGTSYSTRFNASLMMLTLVTTLVMNVIGNNIALSLGMVGALSIVRFRTAIKDPRDTAYIFWCIAVGICCGVSEYLIAGVGTAVIFGLMLVFGFVHSNDRFLIVMRGPSQSGSEAQLLMDKHFKGAAKMRVHNNSQNSCELIYEVNEKMLTQVKKNGDLASMLLGESSLTTVNIVCQNDEINR